MKCSQRKEWTRADFIWRNVQTSQAHRRAMPWMLRGHGLVLNLETVEGDGGTSRLVIESSYLIDRRASLPTS